MAVSLDLQLPQLSLIRNIFINAFDFHPHEQTRGKPPASINQLVLPSDDDWQYLPGFFNRPPEGFKIAHFSTVTIKSFRYTNLGRIKKHDFQLGLLKLGKPQLSQQLELLLCH